MIQQIKGGKKEEEPKEGEPKNNPSECKCLHNLF